MGFVHVCDCVSESETDRSIDRTTHPCEAAAPCGGHAAVVAGTGNSCRDLIGIG